MPKEKKKSYKELLGFYYYNFLTMLLPLLIISLNLIISIFLSFSTLYFFTAFIITALSSYFLFRVVRKKISFKIAIKITGIYLFAVLIGSSFTDYSKFPAVLLVPFLAAYYTTIMGDILPDMFGSENKIIKKQQTYVNSGNKVSEKTDNKSKTNEEIPVEKNDIILIVLFEFLFAYITTKVILSSYVSIYPKIILIAIFITGIATFLSGKKFYKSAWHILGAVLVTVITLQTVVPVFAPKISVSSPEFSFGEVNITPEGRTDVGWGTFEVKIKPPLFPLDNSINIPIALSNVTSVDYKEVFPFVFSNLNLSKNFISFNIFADGWTYDELNTKIFYRGDRYPLFMSGIDSANFVLTKEMDDNGRNYYSGYFYMWNEENFGIRMDYIFILNNESQKLLKTSASNYFIKSCDYNGTTCTFLLSSTDGYNFSTILKYEDIIQSEKIFIKNAYQDYVSANSTLQNIISFKPIKYGWDW